MSNEIIGYTPKEITGMPEVRSNIVEAKFTPRLNRADSILLQASDPQVDFFASILS